MSRPKPRRVELLTRGGKPRQNSTPETSSRSEPAEDRKKHKQPASSLTTDTSLPSSAASAVAPPAVPAEEPSVPSRVTRIMVSSGAKSYTYETDLDVKVGDRVSLPSKYAGGRWVGEVTALTSAYTGPCKRILEIVGSNGKEPQAAVEQADGSPLSDLLKASIAQVQSTKRTPTDEQRHGIEEAKKEPPILVMEAGAGCGKTAWLQMLESELKGRGQYTAYNRAIVDNSRTKFRIVKCKTTHGLAFGDVGKRFERRLPGNANNRRMRSTEIAAMLGVQAITIKNVDTGADKRLDADFLAVQCMKAVERYCQSADAEVGEHHFKYIGGIDMEGFANNAEVRRMLLPFARKAWADLSRPDGRLPFAHDVYVKIWERGNPVIPADYILLDEAQDTAPVMISVLQQQRNSRLILVGDSQQEIYAWRGCSNAMKAWGDVPRCMLTQSFRFGPAVAEVANAVLGSLAEPAALRLRGLPSIESVVGSVDQPRCVLCRTNAGAIGTVLGAIAEGKKPHLIGGGAEVVAFVRGCKDLQSGRKSSHPDLACFDSWNELVEYSGKDEGEDLRLLVRLVKDFGADKILNALENMPPEEHSDLVVCTAHKSKGREWESVRLAGDFPFHSKANENDKGRVADDADRRLLYVAATRAQKFLDLTRCPFFTGPGSLKIKGGVI